MEGRLTRETAEPFGLQITTRALISDCLQSTLSIWAHVSLQLLKSVDKLRAILCCHDNNIHKR